MPVEFNTLKDWFKSSRTFTEEWRDEARNLRDFVAGRQWDEVDAETLRAQKRPPVVFNRVEVIIDAVAGSEINNRHETAYDPVEVGDAGVSEMITSVVAWARSRCQADDEESDAFRDMIVTGMGCTLTAPDYDGEQPEVTIERVDWEEVVWDHRAKKRNLRDRRYTMRTRRIDAMTAEETWPDKDLDEIHAAWAEHAAPGRETSGQPGRAYAAGSSISGGGQGSVRRDVVVVEAEWWEREKQYEITAVTGVDPQTMQPQTETMVVDGSGREKLTKKLSMMGAPFEVKDAGRRKVFYRAILGGDDFIEKNKMDPQKGGFRFKFMTAKREKKEDGYVWYGLARSGKDPQMWANKFFSQVLHLINSGALGRVIYETGAFVNPRKAQQDWAKANAWIEAERGAMAEGRFQEGQPPPVPTAIVSMLEFAIGSIRECMGVNPELLGQTQRDQPGVLEYQRRQAGMNVLAVLFDALTQYREEQGYLMLHMVLTHMNDGRLVRIVGDDGEKFVPFIYEEGATEFDVRVTEAPSAPDQKERSWMAIQGVLPHLLQANVPPQIWAEIVKHSPLPAPLAEKISNWLAESGKQEETPEMQMQKQMAIRNMMAEIGKTESEIEENKAGALLDMAKAREMQQRLELDALEQLGNTAGKLTEPDPNEQADKDREHDAVKHFAKLQSDEQRDREKAAAQRASQSNPSKYRGTTGG